MTEPTNPGEFEITAAPLDASCGELHPTYQLRPSDAAVCVLDGHHPARRHQAADGTVWHGNVTGVLHDRDNCRICSGRCPMSPSGSEHTWVPGPSTDVTRLVHCAAGCGATWRVPDDAPVPRLIAHTREAARHPWPDSVFIQGGGSGVVFQGGADPYRTAFVEACPPGTFLRGEGATIAEAEDKCWAQYRRYLDCDGTNPGAAQHGPYERRQYTNGAGFCTRCGMWASKVFEPIPADPNRKPTPLERAFAGDLDAAVEIITTVANADQLPPAPTA